MKEDKLKSFIKDHKSDFEQEAPSADLWAAISDGLPQQESEVKMIPVTRMWKAIAGIAAVFAVAFFAVQYSNSSSPNMADSQEGTQFTDVAQLEMYYTTQVNDRIEKLKKYEVDEELLEEIAFLKEEFEALKSEADKGVNTEDILDSMIDNYRMRVDILEEIMREVQHKSQMESSHVEQ